MAELQTVQTALVHDQKIGEANRLMRAFAGVRELRAELETQSVKIADAKNAVRAARLDGVWNRNGRRR